MQDAYTLLPIGTVVKEADAAAIVIDPEYRAGLLGIEQFSHLVILYWFHENDRPADRAVLQVHPRADTRNPLTGVFATRSPKRPNLIAMTVVELLEVKNGRLHIDAIDARHDTPVIDIKPFICEDEWQTAHFRMPSWVKKS